jgi:peptidoglycan/LPS O-acetylase OafA/YrhL
LEGQDRTHTGHVRALDGLRGIAVLLVVLPHVQLTGSLPGPAIIQKMVHESAHGVEIFFVLSGLGLALPLLRSIHTIGSARLDVATYAFNRVFRIIPLYYIALVIVAALNVYYLRHWQPLPPTLALPHTPVQALGQLVFLDRNIDPIDSNFWSIPIQLRWYLAFPLLLLLYVRSSRAFFAVLVATVLAYNATRLHAMDIGTLPLFMLGIVAADVFVRQHPLQKWGFAIAAAGVFLGHIGDRWASMPDPHGVEIVWAMQPTTLGWQIATFGLVLAAGSNSAFRFILGSRVLVWLGAASFSIYLMHEPVIEIGARILGANSGLVTAGLGLIAGGALWFCVERHIAAPALRRRLRARTLPLVNAGLAFIGLPLMVSMSEKPREVLAEPNIQAKIPARPPQVLFQRFWFERKSEWRTKYLYERGPHEDGDHGRNAAGI